MTDYSRAPEVEEIANDLIKTVKDHRLLAGVHIEYVWRDKHSKSKGKVVLAKARLVGGLNAYLTNASAGIIDFDANEPLFVIEVAADTWERLDDKQRRALIDHELCHCHVEDDGDGLPVLSIRGHDVEEFGCIVERHGLWKSDVAYFGGQVAEQLALAVDEASSFLRNGTGDRRGAPSQDEEAAF